MEEKSLNRAFINVWINIKAHESSIPMRCRGQKWCLHSWWREVKKKPQGRPSRLCARARSVDDMPFRTRACMGCTRWVFCKRYGRPRVHHLVYPTKRHGSRLWSFQEFVSSHDWIPQLAHLFVLVIRGGETVSNSVFKHDLCKLVIAKMGSAITYDSTRGTESGEERFKKFANNSGVVGGERFRFTPILTIVDSSLGGGGGGGGMVVEGGGGKEMAREDGNGPMNQWPTRQRFRKLGWNFEAFHHVAKFFLDVDKCHIG
ncbi:hypothetical protein Tco_1472923 [Tanacetum coccineum]